MSGGDKNKWQKVMIVCVHAGFPFGKLPILEMDGMKMHQSAAIIRYLARKAGGTLYGRDQFEALQCDVAYDTISDLRVSKSNNPLFTPSSLFTPQRKTRKTQS